MKQPFQIAMLFEGTGLDGDSQSNVGRLARALVRDERQHVILKNGSGTYHFAHLGGRIAVPPVPPETFHDAPTV